jgi:hypothetical protein
MLKESRWNSLLKRSSVQPQAGSQAKPSGPRPDLSALNEPIYRLVFWCEADGVDGV